MAETGQRVPENSATYQQFARLYDLARHLPTGHLLTTGRTGAGVTARAEEAAADEDRCAEILRARRWLLIAQVKDRAIKAEQAVPRSDALPGFSTPAGNPVPIPVKPTNR